MAITMANKAKRLRKKPKAKAVRMKKSEVMGLPKEVRKFMLDPKPKKDAEFIQVSKPVKVKFKRGK